MLITATEAAERLAAQGVTVRQRGREHPPTVRDIDRWCRAGALKAQKVGSKYRGMWMIAEADLAAFVQPRLGQPVKVKEVVK